MKYWLVVTSAENFKYDRENLGLKLQGIPIRFKRQFQKMNVGDKVVYYIMGLQKFGAIANLSKLSTRTKKSWNLYDRCPGHGREEGSISEMGASHDSGLRGL